MNIGGNSIRMRCGTQPWGAAAGALLLLASCGGSQRPDSAPALAVPRTMAEVSTPRIWSDAPLPELDSPIQLSRVQARRLLCSVLERFDHDHDRRVTLDDDHLGSAWPSAVAVNGAKLTLRERYNAAQLVQELAQELARTANLDSGNAISLIPERVQRSPVATLLERIETRYWDALTRRVEPDRNALRRATRDEKMGALTTDGADWCADGHASGNADGAAQLLPEVSHLYVPASDPDALVAFQALETPELHVHAVPPGAGALFVDRATLENRHGLLALGLTADGHGRPFVVPGGRFNEMYGWDSYFIALGLVNSPRHRATARAMVDNLAYEIHHYGQILNANRSYYLTRSQPPFLSAMIGTVWDALQGDDAEPGAPASQADMLWLKHSLLAAAREYQNVWNSAAHRTTLCQGSVCLARYWGAGTGQPPEVEPGHFDWFYQIHAQRTGQCTGIDGTAQQQQAFIRCAAKLGADYRDGRHPDPVIDRFFKHDRCMRESGHDTSFRWFDDAEQTDRCADFATVDLNSLLLRYELDLAREIDQHFDGVLEAQSTQLWCQRARQRAKLIRRHLYDPASSLFLDLDVRTRQRRHYLSATALFPLWASVDSPCHVTLLTPPEAARLVRATLESLEAPGGLAATAQRAVETVRHPRLLKRDGGGHIREERLARQWDFPNGWAPHQMVAWEGLRRHGFSREADRLSYRWLYTIAHNAANYHGTVPEKFNVVSRSHKVFEEYGNVNTDFAYIAEEGFGWMNASFVVGYWGLPPQLREQLKELSPPEQLWPD